MIEAFFGNVIQMLSFPFMVRAFIVGILVALCAALLGVSLVLKRYAMIGDGLSHVGFAALALATALDLDPLRVSIPATVLIACRATVVSIRYNWPVGLGEKRTPCEQVEC